MIVREGELPSVWQPRMHQCPAILLECKWNWKYQNMWLSRPIGWVLYLAVVRCIKCKKWISKSSDCYLVGCDAMKSCRQVPVFLSELLPPPPKHKNDLLPWRWGQEIFPKQWHLPSRLHSVTQQTKSCHTPIYMHTQNDTRSHCKFVHPNQVTLNYYTIFTALKLRTKNI